MASTTTGEELSLETTSACRFDNWQAFVQHLQSRKLKPGRQKITGGATGSLLWGTPRTPESETDKWLDRVSCLLDGTTGVQETDVELLSSLKKLAAEPVLTVGSVMFSLGIAGIMPGLSVHCGSDQWISALDDLDLVCSKAKQQGGLLAQIGNETLLVLGYQLPELVRYSTTFRDSTEFLARQLEELLDTDGAISARYCEWIPCFLAAWTRTISLATACGYEVDDDMAEQWEWFLRYAMRMLRADGTSMLGHPGIPYCLDLYVRAVKLSADKEDRAISRLVLPGGNPKNKKIRRIDEEGVFSEWAGLGVFQQDWSARSPRLAVAMDEQRIRVEVCRGIKLFEMTGLPEVSINGKPLQAIDEWEEVCSHFDDDIDYLELEIALQDNVRLQRQLFLIHGDEILVIADAIFNPSPERIDYQSRFLLPEPITPLQETENNEIYLRQREIESLMLPLNLSEWQSARADDRFQETEEAVTLSQSALGKTLYAPVLIALNPENSIQPRTWRRLTVAEALETLPDDKARAFRVRIGDQQWVFYKSFHGTGNRTFLGQNQACDLFIGRFQEDGNVEELLSLEP